MTESVRVVWRSPQRAFPYIMGPGAVLQAALQWSAGRWPLALMHAGVALLCLIWAVQVGRIRVVSDRRELRVEGPDAAALPWEHVREVRGDAGPWSTRTVVEMHDGRTVLLPQGLEVAMVRQWQHEACPARGLP